MSTKNFDYKKSKQELIGLLDWFESGEADLDETLDKYKRAEELISQLEAYLKDTEKKINITVKNS